MSLDHQKLRASLAQNHSSSQAALSLAGGSAYAVSAIIFPQFSVPLTAVAASLVAIGLSRLPAARRQQRFAEHILGQGRTWMTLKELQEQCALDNFSWIGQGFPWDAGTRQLLADFTNSNWSTSYRQIISNAMVRKYIRLNFLKVLAAPLTAMHTIERMKQLVAHEPGYRWIHALGFESSQRLSDRDLAGHMAVFGTTGGGKSRFLEIQIVQAIFQGKVVVVIDPKGDAALVSAMRKACELAGRPGDFRFFHRNFPEKSINMNLLANYEHASDLASRIADTIPGQGGNGQVFIDMGEGVVRTICDALVTMGLKPTFKLIYRYYCKPDSLRIDTLCAYLAQAGLEEQVADLRKRKATEHDLANSLTELYHGLPAQSPTIDATIALAEQGFESIMNRTSSTWTILDSLVRGDLGDKLSPEPSDNRMFYDTKKLIDQGCVLYVGLAAMGNSGMAKALGSMLLSDLTATAGARLDFASAPAPVALFVDEAAEVACEPLIQMLNKSRSAKFRICLASQTVADFVAKFKDQAEAMRILANQNNFVALRCNDLETQEFLVRRLPKVRIKTRMHTHGISTDASSLVAQGGSISERLVEEEVELIPASLLGSLPNCEFVGIFAGGHVIKGRFPVLVNSAEDYKEES